MVPQNSVVSFLPEFFLAASLLIILLHGSFLVRRAAYSYSYLTPSMIRLTTIILVLSILLVLNNPINSQTIWNNLFVSDYIGTWSKVITLSNLILCLCVCEIYMFKKGFRSFEFFFFLVGIALSLCLLISSYDFLSIFLNLEFLSLIFYVLAGWKRTSFFSAEASLKYFILGSVASAFFLFGVSLIYLSLGTTNISNIGILTQGLTKPFPLTILGLVFVTSALLFKVGAAPYHVWIADVYEGSPTIVSFIFAVIPKLSIFVVIIRLAFTGFWSLFPFFWENFFCCCGLFSLFVGCIFGLGETKIKRLLAFSSVGHTGFLCLGLSTGSLEGLQSVFLYLIIYSITSAFFWTFVLFLDLNHSEEKLRFSTFTDSIGLVKSNPLLGFGITLMTFSLAGIPPLGGFFVKLNIFVNLVDASFYIVSVFVVLTSSISAFYYIRLIKIFYFEKNEKWFFFFPLNKKGALVLIVTSFTVIFFLFFPNIFYLLTYKMAVSLMI